MPLASTFAVLPVGIGFIFISLFLYASAIHCSFILFVFYLASQVDEICKMLVCFIKSCFIICG